MADGEAVRRAGLGLAAAAVGTLQGATPDELTAVGVILAGLEETVDSMGDVLLAEGVHQLVGGSPLRAGLAADTVGRAAPVPDRLDVVRTPRRTVSVNHAVGLAVTLRCGRVALDATRRVLDPVAEAIAAWALGAPGDWTVELTPADGSPVQTSTLADLDVAAIDVVIECDLSAVTQLAGRVVAGGGKPGTVTVRRADGLGGDGALPAVAQVARGLLATARPVAGSSTVVDPFGSTGLSGDLAELAARVGDWWAQVQDALDVWPSGTEVEQRAAVGTLATLGLQGVGFDTPPGAGAVLRERWIDVTLPASPPPVGSSAEAVTWLAALRTDLAAAAGGWVLAAPRWTAADAGWDALGGEEPGGPAVGPDAVDDWLGDHRDACPGVTQLLDVLSVVGACGAGGEAWVLRQHRPAPPGTELPAGWVAVDHPGPRSATHLAVLQIGAPAAGQRAVVIVDRWLETMPVQADRRDHRHPCRVGLAGVPLRPARRPGAARRAARCPTRSRPRLVHGGCPGRRRGDAVVGAGAAPRCRRPARAAVGAGMTTFGRRLLTSARAGGMEEALAARLSDPLWLLARQWQFGEFRGDDAGSVVKVAFHGVAHHATWWRPEPEAASPDAEAWQAWNVASGPLEPVIEAEPADGAARRRLRLDGGVRVRRALLSAGLGHRAAAVAAFAPWPVADVEGAGGLDQAVLASVADGEVLAGLVAPWSSPGEPVPADVIAAIGLEPAEVGPFASAVRSFVEWWQARSGRSSGGRTRRAGRPTVVGPAPPGASRHPRLRRAARRPAPRRPAPRRQRRLVLRRRRCWRARRI